MKKQEFLKIVADKCDMTIHDVDEVMGVMSDTILEVIANEDSFKFGDVGTFSGFTKKAGVARNPKTGETIPVPEKKGYPKMKFSKIAKE